MFSVLLFFSLVIAMEDAPNTLFPPLAISAYSFRVVNLIHRSLFKPNEKLEPEPDLAESYQIISNPDHLEILIKIKENQRTCSGLVIDSTMIQNSINKYKDYGRLKLVKSSEIISKYEIKIYTERNFSVLYELMFPVFPERWTDCTGYFEVVDFFPGQYVLLMSRKSGKKVLIKGIKNDITRILEFEKGDIDILVNAVPPYLLDYLKSLKNVDIITQDSINLTYIALNMKNPYLSKKEVRKAIAYAIDREKIAKKLMNDMVKVINSMIPSISPFYCDTGKFKYDPEKARELLKKAGISENSIELIWKTSTVKYAIRNVKAIANYLEEIGIKVKIIPQEFHKFFQDILEGNYDIYSLNFVGIMSPDILRLIAHSSSIPPNGANRVFFSNPYFDKLIEKAEAEEDFEKRKEFYCKAQEIISEEIPYIPLFQIKDVIAYRTDKISPEKMRKAKFIPGGSLSFLDQIL